MAKPIAALIKLQCPGGQATPAPPVGPSLGQHGVNIGAFVKQFNDRTRQLNGTIVPVVITVYGDKSFDFVVKQPPAAVLIKQACGLQKGAPKPPLGPEEKPDAAVTRAQVKEIAEKKMPDLNTTSVAAAMRIIEGTARSMGVKVVD